MTMGLIVILALLIGSAFGLSLKGTTARKGKQEDLLMDCGTSYKLRKNMRVVVESPNFGTDEPYPPAINCDWRIEGECSLEIFCEQFYLNDLVCLDSLSVINETSHVIEFCGQGEKSYLGDGPLSLRFKSDVALNLPNKGFQCSITCASTSQPEDYDCECGAIKKSRRVVNGQAIEANEFPWMAGIMRNHDVFPICGGSLISSKHVLTAAHCVTEASVANLRVVFTNFQSHTYAAAAEIVRKVARIHEHPEFTYYLDYDAAILELTEPVPLDNHRMWNVCLPDLSVVDQVLYGSEGTACGWGRTSTHGPLSDQLQQTNLTIMSEEECESFYEESGVITPRMLCTYSELRSICEGDSGGPLMTRTKDDEHFLLVGITSWGSQKGCLGRPSVFTKVVELLPWISEIVGNDSKCRQFS